MEFGFKLREWRLKHKLSQKEVAAILDASLHTYRGWEYDHHTPVSGPCQKCIEEKIKTYELNRLGQAPAN